MVQCNIVINAYQTYYYERRSTAHELFSYIDFDKK